MTASEFSRPVDIRQADDETLMLTASETERAALAARFDLVRVDRLEARITLDRNGDVVNAVGAVSADIVQSCAVSAEDLPVSIDEPLLFRFVPARADHTPDEEVELDADDCDEIEYEGTSFDLGEAVAQSLGLAIDPFAVGPQAEEARRIAGLIGEQGAGPFAALKGLGFKK